MSQNPSGKDSSPVTRLSRVATKRGAAVRGPVLTRTHEQQPIPTMPTLLRKTASVLASGSAQAEVERKQSRDNAAHAKSDTGREVSPCR